MSLKPKRPVRAYQIDLETCDGMISEIVWHHSSAAARRIGAARLGVEFEEVDGCFRAPWADALEHDPRGLTRAMWARGWRWECLGSDFEGEPFVDTFGGMWRSPFEWLESVEYRIGRRVAREQAEARALALFPEGEIIGKPWSDSSAVELRLPFLKGAITLRSDDAKGEADGVSVWVQTRDVETFRAAYTINRDANERGAA